MLIHSVSVLAVVVSVSSVVSAILNAAITVGILLKVGESVPGFGLTATVFPALRAGALAAACDRVLQGAIAAPPEGTAIDLLPRVVDEATCEPAVPCASAGGSCIITAGPIRTAIPPVAKRGY